MAWLDALRREAHLAVPQPVPTIDGALVALVEVQGVRSPRLCALFHWAEGRFLNAGLKPSHLQRVGELNAHLHNHAEMFLPPDNFQRWRVGDLTDDVQAWVCEVVGKDLGSDASLIAEAVMNAAREVRRELGERPDAFGLIHADLHQENYLFERGSIRAIDFDDCGWGHYLYDVAVTLSELRGRPNYDELRAGLLRGYQSIRPLPDDHERLIEIFEGLRLLLLTVWFIEQRKGPAFHDWEDVARHMLRRMKTLVS
jgi:Ser/Thr protein kinase RdoA (MazF antagonist)